MFDAPPPAAPLALMQDPAFAAALRRLGQSPATLPCGLTLLRRKICGLPLAMLPRAAPPPDLIAQIKATGLKRCLVILSPETPSAIPHAIRIRAPLTLAQLDLTPSQSQRRAGLHGKWRNQLKRAEAADLRVCHAHLPGDPTHPLLRDEAAQARQNRYTTWPAALTAAFAQAAPRQTRLFTAFEKGHPIAQMLFLLHGTGATYHIGQTTTQGRKHHAHNLLLWQASNWLAHRGITRLELGPLSPATPKLNHFKLRTGASATATGGTWLKIIL